MDHLRHDARKRNDKKSGRKIPRKHDITFTEAPDSYLAEGNCSDKHRRFVDYTLYTCTDQHQQISCIRSVKSSF